MVSSYILGRAVPAWPSALTQPRPQRVGCSVRACVPGAKPVASVRRWVERVVVGLSLCPWASPVLESGGIRYALTEACTCEGVFCSLLEEIDLLSGCAPPMDSFPAEIPETTILVTPNAFTHDFVEFFALVSDVETYLQDMSLDEEFQVLRAWHAALRILSACRALLDANM